MSPLPDIVVQIAAKYIDVLCFQYFQEPEIVIRDFHKWHTQTGLPVLLADAAPPGRGVSEDDMPAQMEGSEAKRFMEQYFAADFVLGWHYCGAYIRNEARKAGLKDHFDNPKTDFINQISGINKKIENMVADLCGRIKQI
jgi:hypothetical protein